MQQLDLPVEMESRLNVLATHIADLKEMMHQAKGARRKEDFVEIQKLERRYNALSDELNRLDREEPDLRQAVVAEIEAGADELTRWIGEHLKWVDSGYRPDLRPKRLD